MATSKKWGVRWEGDWTSPAKGKSMKKDYWAKNVKDREIGIGEKERKRQVYMKGRMSWSQTRWVPQPELLLTNTPGFTFPEKSCSTFLLIGSSQSNIFLNLSSPESLGLVFHRFPQSPDLIYLDLITVITVISFPFNSSVTKLKAISVRNLHSLSFLRINGDPSSIKSLIVVTKKQTKTKILPQK